MFYLSFYLTYILAFYLLYILTFDLAFFLAFFRNLSGILILDAPEVLIEYHLRYLGPGHARWPFRR